MRARSFLALGALLLCALPAWAIDIVDVHQNTAAGVPTLLNQQVTVSGIVTSPNNIFSTYNLEIFIQDATAGVNVWVSGGAGAYSAELGDSVTVTANVAQYSGLTELGTSTATTTIVNHGGGYTVPEPMVITCAELNATFQGDYSEPNEGRLIRINGVSIVSGSWPVTPQTGNSYLEINDGTATCDLFIDKDTSVNGSADPGGTFDVIGILKQYDSSSPYTSGYEMCPRFAEDIVILEPGPPIVGLPYVRNVTESSADVHFETQTPGSSEVEYGLDDSYGMTAGDPGAEETEHVVNLTGLSANTVYHYRVKSSDASGTRYGPDQLLATASDIPGQIHVYMSYTADESYATGDPVQESQNMSSQVTNLINQANYSVDAALYSFSLDNVKNALVGAHNRGCLVRIIIDDGNSSAAADYCAGFGIPYITSTYGGNHGSDDGYGIMHNKFVVVDARDTNPYNDWLWTGSANMSVSGNDDVNNGIKIRDYGLGQAYTLEFNEMWGSDTQTPNAAAALMGANKADDTPHEFTISGLRFEQYMSPSDGVRDKITTCINGADHSIYFAILAFTDYSLSDAMQYRRYDVPDLEIRGVFNQDQGACGDGSVYYEMAGDPCSPYAWSEPADVWLDTALPSNRLLHHKYMVVDVNWAADDPLVVTGSHNWSYSANTYNDENTLIIHDAGVANLFLQEFADRYHESGGTGPLGALTDVGDAGAAPGGGRLLGAVSNYPNPFNPFTNIAFSTKAEARVTVRVYDVGGRLVATLAEDQLMESGYHVLGWKAEDASGRPLPSGVYLAQVDATEPKTGHNEKKPKKVILVQ